VSTGNGPELKTMGAPMKQVIEVSRTALGLLIAARPEDRYDIACRCTDPHGPTLIHVRRGKLCYHDSRDDYYRNCR